MAKGDHNRSQNKIDEQQTQAQGYLTGVQGNIGNQYGRNDNLYWGSGAPTYGTINNYGSTTPNYSPYGGAGMFPGNQSGSSYPNSPSMNGGYSGGGGGNANYQDEFQSAVQKLGIAPQQFRGNPQVMDSVTNYLNQQYPGQQWTNGGQKAGDWVGVGGGVNGFDVLPAGDANWQWLNDPAIPGGGGGGGGFGSYGAGGIPGMAMGDYQQLGNEYQSMLPQYQNLYGDLRGQYGNFIGSASNMAQTGGLSEGDKANLRARAISPIRSVYSQGLQDLSRQRALQGGYSPGYSTALGRFNRQEGQQTSDATTNAEAAIAQLVQQGKLGGLSAWSSGLSGMGSGLLGALGGQLSALGGASGLYGTQPGMAKFFGDQLQNATQDQLQAGALQNNLSNSIMQNTNYLGANVPGNTASTLGNVGSALKDLGGLGGALSPWVGGGSGGNGGVNGGFIGPDGSEVYGGSTPGSPYVNYNMPANGQTYNFLDAQGTFNDPGQYGLGDVPNYGQQGPDYSVSQIYPWL